MHARRTTLVLTLADHRAVLRASKVRGLSQAEIIRRGIRSETSAHRAAARIVRQLRVDQLHEVRFFE